MGNIGLSATLRKFLKKGLKLSVLLGLILAISLVVNHLAFAFIDLKAGPVTPRPAAGAVITITPRLLDAIIHVESSHNPRAFNRRTKARGLTQITPITWRELVKHKRAKYGTLQHSKHMYNPEIAKEAGKDYLYILQTHLRAKGIPVTLDNLLAAYVWGPGKLSRNGMGKAPRVVRRYVARVKHLARLTD